MGRRKLEIKRIEKSYRQVAFYVNTEERFVEESQRAFHSAMSMWLLLSSTVADSTNSQALTVVVVSAETLALTRLNFSDLILGGSFGIHEEGIFDGLVPNAEIERHKICSEFSYDRDPSTIRKPRQSRKRESAEIQVAEHSKCSAVRMEELLQTTKRQLKETNADDLTVTGLIPLEKELHATLTQIRSRKLITHSFPSSHLITDLASIGAAPVHWMKMDRSVKRVFMREKQLLEEKKLLEDNMAKIQEKTEHLAVAPALSE
ncbi:hypothetical protein HAX54_005120 [Datura stramonium]|uniref:Uncharacterized protein n=1 Tax=Datura stramonium TaxID=4076 RepID=A0ABS8WVT9_DATST|nr:hypothetical protein [Datura stramonium]